jgi:hypothetical protein
MLALAIEYLHATICETDNPEYPDRIPPKRFPKELRAMIEFVDRMIYSIYTGHLVPERTKTMVEALFEETRTGVPCGYTINEPQYILK